MRENEVSQAVVSCAVEVHRCLGGPGLLESIYEEALAAELQTRGLVVERQVQVPVMYKGRRLSAPLRLDLRIEGSVLVEAKATSAFQPLFTAQMLTYLRLTGLRLGLVLNFGERYIRDGIHRVVNHLN